MDTQMMLPFLVIIFITAFLLGGQILLIFVILQKSDVFTEGEEDLDDDNTVNGGEEEEEEDEIDDDDPDRSIEFRSEIGSTGKTGFLLYFGAPARVVCQLRLSKILEKKSQDNLSRTGLVTSLLNLFREGKWHVIHVVILKTII